MMLRQGAHAVACADEVGRGALSGPVTVGMVVITAQSPPAPRGVRDSKLLSSERRERLAPHIRQWAPHAVGHASPAEVDAIGIIAAMRRAAVRALAALPIAPDRVLLDGNHDYVTPPEQVMLFDEDEMDEPSIPTVVTMVKADLRCAGVAAASILAKTERDAIMRRLSEDFPAYGWSSNMGYAAPDHLDALARLGPTEHHRRSWRLPGPTHGSHD